MSPRKQKFEELKSNAWFKRIVEKLSQSDIKFIESFISENEFIFLNDWEMKVNRVFLDNPDKPKNWKYIMELLTVIGPVMDVKEITDEVVKEYKDRFVKKIINMSYFNAAEGNWVEETAERNKCREELKELAKEMISLGIDVDKIHSENPHLTTKSDYKS